MVNKKKEGLYELRLENDRNSFVFTDTLYILVTNLIYQSKRDQDPNLCILLCVVGLNLSSFYTLDNSSLLRYGFLFTFFLCVTFVSVSLALLYLHRSISLFTLLQLDINHPLSFIGFNSIYISSTVENVLR